MTRSRFLRWPGRLGAFGAVLTLLLAGYVHVASERVLHRKYEIPSPTSGFPPTSHPSPKEVGSLGRI